MNGSKIKSLLGLGITLYIIATLFLVLGLSHYPWPTTPPTVQSHYVAVPAFKSIKNIKKRKATFFSYFRPLIESKNLAIAAKRKTLDKINSEWQEKQSLSKTNTRKLKNLASQYEVDAETPEQTISELYLRINVIPEALVLAQAASESAWGTSRFARDANNYFGQWCFSKGCGVVPNARNQGATHEVAAFNSAAESLAAYYKNINTFNAYEELRQKRQQLASANLTISASALLPTLGSYSERGMEYIDDLRAIIRQNNLE